MNEFQYAKTSNRSVVGIMNQFSYHAEGYREYLETDDLLTLSLKLSETPCKPLLKGGVSPDRELRRLVSSLPTQKATNPIHHKTSQPSTPSNLSKLPVHPPVMLVR